jgi:hypothetical protein
MKKIRSALISSFILLLIPFICASAWEPSTIGIQLGSPGYATLAQAIATIGSAKKTLFVPASGVFTVSSDLTIPSNIALEVSQGAFIQIPSGVTLHIQGPFIAGAYQVFQDNSGDLTKGVKFARTCGLVFVRPEWWGALGNGQLDCAPAITQAINSADLIPGSIYRNRIPVQFGRGTYECNSTINLVDSITLSGDLSAGGATVLVTPNNVSWPLIAGNNTGNICLNNITFKSGAGGTGKLIYLYGGGRCGVIQGCSFDTSSYPTDGQSWALYLYNHFRIQVYNNYFSGGGGAYMYGCDSWFYNNQMKGPGQQNAPGSMALALEGVGSAHSNTIDGWYTGIFMASNNALMLMNNKVSHCVYALRNSGNLNTVGAGGASGSIIGNTLTNNVYGYTCDRGAKGVIIENNQFIGNNCVYCGPVPANDPYIQYLKSSSAALVINGGNHIITNNLFSGNTANLAGTTQFYAYNNSGIDVPISSYNMASLLR